MVSEWTRCCGQPDGVPTPSRAAPLQRETTCWRFSGSGGWAASRGAGLAETAPAGRAPRRPPSLCELLGTRSAPTSAPRVTIARGRADHGARGGSSRRSATPPGAGRAAGLGCRGADPRSGELTHSKVRPPGSDLDLQVSLLPAKQPRLELSLPRRSPSAPAARAQSSGNGGWWVVGGPGEALLYQPGSSIFLQ